MPDRVVSPNRLQLSILASALLALTFYGTIVPLQYRPTTLESAISAVDRAPWHVADSRQMRADWILNSIQYGFLGFFCLGALAVDRRRVWSVACAIGVAVLGWKLAYWLEVLQVAFPPRTISANDVFVERVGILSGCGCWIVFGQPLIGWFRSAWNRRGVEGLTSQILPAYVCGLLIVSWIPFDVALSLQDLVEKNAEGRIHWSPFSLIDRSVASNSFADRQALSAAWLGVANAFFAFVPIGGMLGIQRRWNARSLGVTAMAGFFLASIVEFGQLIVMSHDFRCIDMVAATLATTLTAAWVRQFQGRVSARESAPADAIQAAFRRWGARFVRWGAAFGFALILLLAIGMVAMSWYPFDFRFETSSKVDPPSNMASRGIPSSQTLKSRLTRMTWAPFVDYYYGSRTRALEQIAQRSLFFMPLGAISAAFFGQRPIRGRLVGFVMALGVGLLIEIGQCYIPERSPSGTDLYIHLFGTGLGYDLMRHAIITIHRGP